MTHTERRIWLIKELQKQPSQFSDYLIPANELEQKDLLRALMNIWIPEDLSDKFLHMIIEKNRETGSFLLLKIRKEFISASWIC